MAVISQRNNFRLGFWAFTLMEESSEPCATLSRKISGTRIHRTAGGAPIACRLIWPQMNTDGHRFPISVFRISAFQKVDAAGFPAHTRRMVNNFVNNQD
jgi:hypothetical protein